MAAKNRLEDWLRLIGIKLAFLRKLKGYESIKKFAEEFNLAQIHYWRIENGRANLTLNSLYKLLRIHKVSFREFFCDFESPKFISKYQRE
jgi:transcriptional regulator with XRE-family HTH domain